MNRGRETERPGWRRKLAWKSFGTLGPAAARAVVWALGHAIPGWVLLTTAVASALFSSCWWIAF